MKPGYFVGGTLLLVCSLPAPVAQALGSDEALCRGDYPVLLMTEQECRTYAAKVRTLRSAGQSGALSALKLRHAEQLSERAAVCPCMENKLRVAPPQYLVMLEPDC